MMIKVILWDIDGTLLNFKEAEKYAIRKCFSVFHLGECTDSMLRRYSEINADYWRKLERGEISKSEVLHHRFADFFHIEGIVFTDVDAFNREYQLRLGDTVCFHDNSYPLVKRLKNRVRQYAVTNGTYAAQSRKLARSGLDCLFDEVFISEKVGVEKPNKAFFDYIWEQIGTYAKQEVIIVGDSLTSDMQGGTNAGITCCWYNPACTENTSDLKPDYEIRNLWELENIIEDSR